MSRFSEKQYVGIFGANNGDIARVKGFSKDGARLTVEKINTSGVLAEHWTEYYAQTIGDNIEGTSVARDYKGAPLAQTKIVELPPNIAAIAAEWLEFEGQQIAGLKDMAAAAKRDAIAAYRAAFKSLGANFGIGVKKLTGKLGANDATCTVEVKQVGAGLFGARVKFFDKDAEEAYQTMPKDFFFTDGEVEVAVGKAVKAISLPATWQIDAAPVQAPQPAPVQGKGKGK